jgi:hypothetical protein
VHARFVFAEVTLEIAAAQCGFGGNSHGPQITMEMASSVNRLPLDGDAGFRQSAPR